MDLTGKRCQNPCSCPLPVSFLQIARGDIVGDGVAENGLFDILLGQVFRYFSTTIRVRFMLNPLGLPRKQNWLPLVIKAEGGFINIIG